MKRIEKISDLKELVGENVEIGITIGNFDGVHLGHRRVIEVIKQKCTKLGLKFLLITFSPHPVEILFPEKKRFLIYSPEKKFSVLNNLGVDYYLEIPFTRDFSTMSPQKFLESMLQGLENIKYFFVGHDFAFGAQKAGDHQFIQEYCRPLMIKVELLEKYLHEGERVSSSLIRKSLEQGKVEEANKLLSDSFSLDGIVRKGQGRGKKIGFPTANIFVDANRVIPKQGVYYTRTIIGDMTYNSVTNIGDNPTFDDVEGLHIETHIFDFDRDIYGEKIEINFLGRLRDEKKFKTVNHLIQQIKLDVEKAREILDV